MGFTDRQNVELSKPLDAKHVKERTQSGRAMTYIEGWHAIAEANRIFGFDGWTRETVEMREVRPPEMVRSGNGKETWRVGFIAKVRVVAGGVVREGTGYGSGALPDLGEAYESAVKEAETDAMKRALMTFGNPFGLALYDKTQANVADALPVPDTALLTDIEKAASKGALEAAFSKAWKSTTVIPVRNSYKAAYDRRKAALAPPPTNLDQHLDNLEKELGDEAA